MVSENYIEHAAGETNNDRDNDNDDALTSFRYAIPSKKTEKDSLIRLGYFFNFLDIPGGDNLNEQASNFLAQVAAANPNPK
jgi:hypothetical protein